VSERLLAQILEWSVTAIFVPLITTGLLASVQCDQSPLKHTSVCVFLGLGGGGGGGAVKISKSFTYTKGYVYGLCDELIN
jgi:hypothetical protein